MTGGRDRAPLNVIGRRVELDRIWETYFIKEVLLAKIGRPIRLLAFEDTAPLPMMDDVLVLSFGATYAPYLRDARSHGCRNLGLFHLADEHGTHDRTFYADADYVLRHYWHDAAMTKPHPNSLGVNWVPNGYRFAFGPICRDTLLPMRHRNISAFFAGTIEARTLSDERRAMVEAIKLAKLPFLAIETKEGRPMLGPTSYAAYLLSTRFALVPSGNSPETVRFYEALEAGAIPIMLRGTCERLQSALGRPPVMMVDSWADLAAAYQPFADAQAPAVVERLQSMQDQLLLWWTDFVAEHQRKVAEVISASFLRSVRSPN
jgi:hypothetical protein